jgi:hypothetical protein
MPTTRRDMLYLTKMKADLFSGTYQIAGMSQNFLTPMLIVRAQK